MRYILCVLALFSFVTACKSGPNMSSGGGEDMSSPRGPSSITDLELAADETTVKAINDVQNGLKSGSGTLRGNVERRVSQIVAGSARGYLLLKEFDKQLDDADKRGSLDFRLERNSVYLKLQATRHIIEALEGRIIAVYAHVWKIHLGLIPEANTPAIHERARKLLEAFHKQINGYASDLRVVALMRLNDHFELVAESLISDVGAGRSAETQKLYTDFTDLISNINAKSSQVEGVDYNEFINAMGSIKDNEIDKAIRDVKAPKRAPNSEFKNINGNGFGDKVWALTFDDGPHKDNTRAIVKVLKDNNIKGEFFWLSNNVKTFQTIAKEVYDAGHRISSHSIDHANLPKLSDAAIKNQVSGSRDVITQVLLDKGASGYKMTHFRCPYGAGVLPPKSQKVMDAVAAADLTHIAWNVDSLDWQDKNNASVLERVVKQMKAQKHGIILFHDIHPRAAAVVPMLIQHPHVTGNGIKFTQM